MSLKERAIRGFSWALIERISNQAIQFIIGIILARLLTPREYGLIGMIAFFLAVSHTFIVTGFGEALIQKKKPNKNDYSTVFVINIGTGVFFYLLFFFSAPFISSFFNEPLLKNILIVIGLTIIIDSFGMVPRVPLIRAMDFKALTKVSVLATIFSGATAIYLALNGYGVWSLVWRSIVYSAVTTLAINIVSRLPVAIIVNRDSFQELFGFGWKLLFSRLIDEFYNNIYYLLIGKFFSARDLGLYTRASGYKDLPSKTLSNLVQSVSFPALSSIQDDARRLKSVFRRMIQASMFVTFSTMFILAGAAENFIIGLIGHQWEDAIPLLQLLCFAGVFYPLSYLNLNLLTVKGRADLNLRVEIIRKLIALPIVVFCLFFGLMAMIYGLILASLINAYLTLSFSGDLIDYPVREQLADIIPSFLVGIIVGGAVYLLGNIVLPPLLMLCIQVSIGGLATIALSDIVKLEPYLDLKRIIFSQLHLSNNWN